MKNQIRNIVKQIFITLITVGVIAFGYQTLAAPLTQSSVPLVIPYQGTLTNASGQPINSNTNFTFAIYNTQSGGTALWTESQSNVPVQNGLFNVRLGSVTPIPSTVWNNNPLYVGVKVGSDAEMSPREPVGAVPFAMMAGGLAPNAQATGNVNVNGNKLDKTGNIIGVGQSSPAQIHMPGDVGTEGNLYLNWDTGNNLLLGAGTQSSQFSVIVDKNGNGTVDLKLRDDSALRDDSSRIFHIVPWGGSGHRWDAVCIGCGANVNLMVRGSLTHNALIEGNLQTPEELNSLKIARFTPGDVLCWDGETQRLEKCQLQASPLVVAVADKDGKPIVLGAEPIKVTGQVKPGDLLVASSITGHAVAWSQIATDSPPIGVVIAKALESFNGQSGLIKAMILQH